MAAAAATPGIKALPIAKTLFPTLRRFAHLRPRAKVWGPIGDRDANENMGEVWLSIPHLYHDLGVLAFAGASPSQITRIGDILHSIVSVGGLGEVSAYLQWVHSNAALDRSRWRAPPVQDEDLFKSPDPLLDNVLSPSAAIRIGDAAVRERIHDMLRTVDPEKTANIEVRQRSIVYHKDPPARTINANLSTGPHRLPVYALTNITVDPRHSGLLLGEARLYAGSEIAGICHFLYALLTPRTRPDGSIQIAAIKPKSMFSRDQFGSDLPRGTSFKDPWGPNERRRRLQQYQNLSNAIFRPLWHLEDEIYGEKIHAYMANERGDEEGPEQKGAPERFESQKLASLRDRMSKLEQPGKWSDNDQPIRSEALSRLARNL